MNYCACYVHPSQLSSVVRIVKGTCSGYYLFLCLYHSGKICVSMTLFVWVSLLNFSLMPIRKRNKYPMRIHLQTGSMFLLVSSTGNIFFSSMLSFQQPRNVNFARGGQPDNLAHMKQPFHPAPMHTVVQGNPASMKGGFNNAGRPSGYAHQQPY